MGRAARRLAAAGGVRRGRLAEGGAARVGPARDAELAARPLEGGRGDAHRRRGEAERQLGEVGDEVGRQQGRRCWAGAWCNPRVDIVVPGCRVG